MPDNRALGREWLTRGDHDVQVAGLALQAGGALDTIVALIHQGVEKHLKGYLISRGWRLQKTHNLLFLVDEAVGYDVAFREYVDVAERLNVYYAEARYPPGAILEYLRQDIGTIFAQAQTLMARIRDAVG